MATTLYDMSTNLPKAYLSPTHATHLSPGIPLFVRGLTQLSHVLSKGESWAKENNKSPDELLQARLAPDMQPLRFQIHFACNSAKAVLSRVAGLDWVTEKDDETTLAQMQERLARTVALLRTAEGQKEAFVGKEENEVTVTVPGREFKFTALVYLQYWAVPNFFFHVTTAYDILRHSGVQIGKADFVGAP